MSVVNAFAIFYVAAQVIERVTDFLVKVTKTYDNTKAEIKTAEMRIEDLKKKIDGESDYEKKENLYYDMEDLLKHKNKLDNKMVFQIFLFTSFLGIAMAYMLGIRFLEMLGESVNPTADTIVTGLVIGSGTKPLHDLIKYIEKAKK